MKRTKRKARYYQNGGLQGVVNSAKSATIKAPSSFFGIQSGGFGAGNSGGFENASLGIDTSLNGGSSKDFNLGDNFSEGSTAYSIASGVAGLLPRAIATLHDYSKSLNLFGEKDDLDIQLENMTKDAQQKANAINFKGSNASLNAQSTEMPLIDSATADDFGGYKNEWTTGLEGAGKGAMASSGLGWQGALIGGSVDAIFRGGAATNRNARLGKNNWLTRNTSPWQHLGWALGMPITGNFLGVLAGDSVADRMKDRNVVDAFNKEAQNLNTQIMNKFNYAVKDADTTNDLWRLQNMYNTNYAAFGGLLETNGSNWKTGASYIENGGTHEMNPNDGVQYGIASDGLPNLVEEGEVVIKVKDNQEDTGEHSYAKGGPMYSDYVLSNRVIPTVEELIFANITDNPSKYEGQPYAQIYKDLTKGLKETINSPITKNYLDILHTRIARAQEDTKLREQQEQIMAALKKATPEQQDILLQQAGYPNPLDEAVMAAQGGKIYIKPSKRGTFTAAATKHGMGVQEFASKVLANKEDYSPAMVKKANFGNASHWHQWGGWKDQEELSSYYQQQFKDYYNNVKGWKDYKHNYNPAYLTGAQARQWVRQLEAGNEQQRALADMLRTQWGDDTLDWSENANWEFKNKYNPNGTIIESSPYIRWAGNNAAMKDALWGIKHVPQLSVDNRYLYKEPVVENEVLTIENELPSPNVGPTVIMPDITPEGTLINLGSVGEDYVWNNVQPEIVNPFKDSQDYRVSTVNTDIYPVPIIKHVRTPKDIITDSKDTEVANSGYNTDWILPTISGATVLGDALGITNIPDYSNADRYGRAILPPTLIGYNPNGRYVKPLLTDSRYISSKLANQSNTAIAAARDLSGSNRATALANIALNNYLNNQAIGQSLAQTDAANNAAIREAVKMNNEVDRANAQGMLTADQANQSELERYASRYAHQKNLEAQLREQIDNQVSANRSANWNNFLENLQGYFDNQRNRNMANESYGRIFDYTNATNGSGHILYGENKKKKKTKKNKR